MVVARAAVMSPLLNHDRAAGLHIPTAAAPSTQAGNKDVARSHLQRQHAAEIERIPQRLLSLLLLLYMIVLKVVSVACFCSSGCKGSGDLPVPPAKAHRCRRLLGRRNISQQPSVLGPRQTTRGSRSHFPCVNAEKGGSRCLFPWCFVRSVSSSIWI